MRTTRRFLLAAAVWLTFSSASALAAGELVLSAPPRETPEAGQEVYGPLAAHLTQLLGQPVVYKHPENWLKYQNEMRNGAYDLVFDGPHFVSWRMTKLDHHVLAKLPGTLQFVLVAKASDAEINEPDDLVGQKVCALPPPNLATMTVISQYNNPVRQPIIKGVPGGFGKVWEAFRTEGTCRAAVFRNVFYDKQLSAEDRAGNKLVSTSAALPNQALSAGPRVPAALRRTITESLTTGSGVAATQPLLARFGGQAKAMVPATQAEYAEHYLLLEGVVFGW